MDVPEEDNVQISKRQAIQAIMSDSSLTPQEKQKKIQKFMAAGGITAESTKPETEADSSADAEEQPIMFRQDQVKAIMRDSSLSTEEKQIKIRGIMSSASKARGISRASGLKPPPSPAVGASPSTVMVDAAARKMKRESDRNLQSSRGDSTESSGSDKSDIISPSQVSRAISAPIASAAAIATKAARPSTPNMISDTSPARSPEPSPRHHGDEPPTRQQLVREVMKDSSLSSQEKQQRVRNIFASAAPALQPSTTLSKQSVKAPASHLVGAAAAIGATVDPAGRKVEREPNRKLITEPLQSPSASASRRNIGGSIRKSTFASPSRISPRSPRKSPRKSRSPRRLKSPKRLAPAPPLLEAENEDESAELAPASRQELVREVMKDSSLTPQEKQQKVREIMASVATPIASPSSPLVGAASISGQATDPAAFKMKRLDTGGSRRSLPSDGSVSSFNNSGKSTQELPFSSVGANAVTGPTVDLAARKMRRERSRNLTTPSNYNIISERGNAGGNSLSEVSTKQQQLKAIEQKQAAAEDVISDGDESDSSSITLPDDVEKNTASGKVGPVPSLVSVDPAARKLQRESSRLQRESARNARSTRGSGHSTIRGRGHVEGHQPDALQQSNVISDGDKSDSSSITLPDDVEKNTASGKVGPVPSLVSVDPAARKLQRESSKLQRESARNYRSTRGSGHSTIRGRGHVKGHQPDALQQSMIQSVLQDSNLSTVEKQEQVRKILSRDAEVGVVAGQPQASTQESQIRENGGGKEAEVANKELVLSEAPVEIVSFLPVPNHVDADAVCATDVYTEDDIEEEEEARKRRVFWGGCCCFCILAIVIVTTFLSLAPDEEAIVVVNPDISESPTNYPIPSPIPPPSAAPTRGAVLDLLFELEILYPSTEDYIKAFDSTESAQYKALAWVTGEGNTNSLAGTDPRMVRRFALACFYFATNGDEWVRCNRDGTSCNPGAEWLIAEDECGWLAITCADGTNDVTQIFFPPTGGVGGNNIAGTLPLELSFLPELTRITISRNNIGGSIPAAWDELTKLEAFVMIENQLTGELPASLINNNPNLRQIRLQGNQISQLPQDSVRSSGLTLLNLQKNALEGTIPAGIKGLSTLQTLDLQGNNLNGTIPESLFQIESLKNVYLSDNSLSGIVPASFDLLTSIRRVELTGNNFTGAIPDGLCALKSEPGDLQFLTADCSKVVCACCDNDCPLT